MAALLRRIGATCAGFYTAAWTLCRPIGLALSFPGHFFTSESRHEAEGRTMLKEFREFALKGNMVDLAIGVIIGAAFGGLVQSIVNDLLMPIIGLITGGHRFLADLLAVERRAGGHPRRGPQSRRDARLWPFHHAGDQLPDRRLGAVPGGQGDEPDEAQGGGQAGLRAATARGRAAADRDPRPARQASSSARSPAGLPIAV